MKQSVENILFRAWEERIVATPAKEIPNGPSRRRLTAGERTLAVKMLERKVHPSDVALHFGVEDASIYRMWKKAKKKVSE